MTHFVGYKEVSREEKVYLSDIPGEKITLEIEKDENEDEDWTVEMEHIFDEEDDNTVCKVEFWYESRVTKIFNEYFIDEYPLLEAKEWFLNHLKLVKDLARDAADLDVTIERVNSYLRAIADLELNTIIRIDDWFEIKCFAVDRRQIDFNKKEEETQEEEETQVEREQNIKLINAAENGNLKIVQTLIENGANINSGYDGLDDQAIRVASFYGYLDVVKYLVEHGADFLGNDNAAIKMASRNGHLAVVNYLSKHGAKYENEYAGIEPEDLHLYPDVAKFFVKSSKKLPSFDDEELPSLNDEEGEIPTSFNDLIYRKNNIFVLGNYDIKIIQPQSLIDILDDRYCFININNKYICFCKFTKNFIYFYGWTVDTSVNDISSTNKKDFYDEIRELFHSFGKNSDVKNEIINILNEINENFPFFEYAISDIGTFKITLMKHTFKNKNKFGKEEINNDD